MDEMVTIACTLVNMCDSVWKEKLAAAGHHIGLAMWLVDRIIVS